MSLLTLPLEPYQLALLEEQRRAVLATLAADGRARLVPITYAYDPDTGLLYSALDDKRKSVDDPRELARVRDIAVRPRVSVLVDRWSEDWSRLAWLRLDGEATLLEPADHAEEHAWALHLLRGRYPQYASHSLAQRPVVRVEITGVAGWSA
ncbi:MAG TPA: TIGR03668 family PPOX class F420-dependent oxidoreductase [Candidatus Limnocylindria bacterium]|nr:TIGR03668 family PPOX class F420-dependent oxidoreductase [Candidatus Limnocylindria bacterium]